MLIFLHWLIKCLISFKKLYSKIICVLRHHCILTDIHMYVLCIYLFMYLIFFFCSSLCLIDVCTSVIESKNIASINKRRSLFMDYRIFFTAVMISTATSVVIVMNFEL